MDQLLPTGISIIIAIQSLGAWLTGPMKLFSLLGSEEFFTLFLSFLYWCVDAALGIRLCCILLISTDTSELLKLALHGPRPYWISTQVQALSAEPSFGVPSGHAQISAGLWGMTASYVGRAWAWVAALLLVALIGLSRLYLGVHFPHDVVVGWGLGFLTLWAFTKLWSPLLSWVRSMSMSKQIGLAFALSLAMILPGVLLVLSARGWTMPALWLENAARSGGAPPNPLSLGFLIPAAGTLFGQCVGLAWIAPRGGFSAKGPLGQRALRFLVGMVGVAAIYAGLKAVFPRGDGLLPLVCRYLRYGLLGFWVTGGAVWVFQRLKLASPADR